MSSSPPSPTMLQRLQRRLGLGAPASSASARAPSRLTLLQAAEARTRQLELLLSDTLALVRISEERTRTLQYQLTEALELLQGANRRAEEAAQAQRDLAEVVRTTDARTLTLEQQLLEARSGLHAVRTAQHDSLELQRFTEERTRTLHHQLDDALALLRVTEERSRSQHYLAQQTQLSAEFELDFLLKWYAEAAPRFTDLEKRPGVRAALALQLRTDHPIAEGSNDHIAPESTVEGVVRPTAFVAHCLAVLGPGLRCLDLGTGGGGLVYECVMHDVPAIGLDGSDHCRINRIGYWPLLPHNLRTCDVTQPFGFTDAAGAAQRFELVTAWEMLEHIPEDGVDALLRNVHANLAPGGYFLASVSLLEYNGPDGIPYHVTLQPAPWWRERVERAGLEWVEQHPFDERLFIRGNGPRYQDFHNYRDAPEEGFHLVARRAAEHPA